MKMDVKVKMDMKKFNELSPEEQKKDVLEHGVEAMRELVEHEAAAAKTIFDTEEEIAARRAHLEAVFSETWDRVIKMTENEFGFFMFGKMIGVDGDMLNKAMEALK